MRKHRIAIFVAFSVLGALGGLENTLHRRHASRTDFSLRSIFIHRSSILHPLSSIFHPPPATPSDSHPLHASPAQHPPYARVRRHALRRLAGAEKRSVDSGSARAGD